MGIPSYFAYIIRNHMNILKKFNAQTHQFQNLYLDSNSIIYDSVREIDKAGKMMPVPSDNYKNISAMVCTKLQKYIDEIRPSNTVYIAFDGVAPLAKMKQQRARRYRTAFMEKHGIIPKSVFSTSLITPGTDFMIFLSKYVNEHFASNTKIIVSAADIPGEGEHKLFQYIRENPEKHMDQNTVIYGLDADLLMLSIFNNRASNMFVYREAPEFAKSLNAELENGASYILDINMLCDSILAEMNCKSQHFDRIYDYAFLCFMLGNDFLPHFPALNIRTNGIYNLLTAYKETVGSLANTFIIANGEIQWAQFDKVVKWMAKREEEWMRAEYIKRGEIRFSMSGDKETVFNNAPLIYREVEHYINPTQPKWEQRYYKALFGPDVSIENVCANYYQMLEWVYDYYTGECMDWRCQYESDDVVLLKDLKKVKEIKKESREPYSTENQKAYVLVVGVGEVERKWAYSRYLWEVKKVCVGLSVGL
jgi:5'-3' exonuclease